MEGESFVDDAFTSITTHAQLQDLLIFRQEASFEAKRGTQGSTRPRNNYIP
jgi:hypothetical protein